MDKITVKGGVPLHGTIEIGGAKNAALPLMAACLLTDDDVELYNVPFLTDITTMANLLVSFGVDLSMNGTSREQCLTGRSLVLNAGNITDTTAHYDIVRKMRASILVLAPLLVRKGQTKVSLPGGCAIGARPVNLHLKVLEEMGAEIRLEEGYVHAAIPEGGLRGAEINFPIVSVGATETALMATVLSNGTSIIKNAACEPEVTDLANLLVAMGADISGIGTTELTINGVKKLRGTKYKVIGDRIEAGTYAIAAAITGGEIELVGIDKNIMGSTFDYLRKAGVIIEEKGDSVIAKSGGKINPLNISTAPYPDFATDMQAQFMALMCLADGESVIAENIFENRFMHVPELQRMGANITINGNKAIIKGIKQFNRAEVMATDLRASVSMVLAALAADGETIIRRVYHIDRGYERVEEKLAACGALIVRSRAQKNY